MTNGAAASAQARANMAHFRPPDPVVGPPYCPCGVCGRQVWDLGLLSQDPIEPFHGSKIAYEIEARNVWHAHPCGHAWVGGGEIDFVGLTYTFTDVHERAPLARFDPRTETWVRRLL